MLNTTFSVQKLFTFAPSNNLKKEIMSKTQARAKLERNGYKVITCMSGNYIAQKGQRTYMAQSLNGLIKLIF
jgi:hypothetical protein